MKSPANRPPRPGERDARLAHPSGDAPGETVAADAESPGEQTIAFGVIRSDDTGASFSSSASAPEGGESAGGSSSDADSSPADDAFTAFRLAAEAAISSVNEVAAAARVEGDAAPPRSSGRTAPSRETAGSSRPAASGPVSHQDAASGKAASGKAASGKAASPEDGAPSRSGAGGGRETEPSGETEGTESDSSPADDAFTAFRLAAEAAISSVNEVAAAARRKDDTVPPLRPARKATGEARGRAAEAPGVRGTPGAPAEASAGRVETEETSGDPDTPDLSDAAEDTDSHRTSSGGGEGEAAARDRRLREVPLPDTVSEALASALAALREEISDLGFGLELPGAEEARRAQSEILAQLDDYVIPRVQMSTAPALIVIAGSTGAGKSTLLNTLANARVSATGVRRPTTGAPVLACHPDDREWFAGEDLLGGLPRQDVPGAQREPEALTLVPSERLPPGVALLDTPDIDSVVQEHHEIAYRMLDVADLWIFVTTAARYADAPAWRLLRRAKERGARLAVVLSRVPPRSRDVVTKHFVRMLTEYGLGDVDRFVVNESKVTGGMLPDHEIAELRLWLTELSVDDERRARAVQATLSGTLDSFRSRIPALARHLEVQVAFRGELRDDVNGAYADALAGIEEATVNGSLLRGETLARWQDFAGTGDLMRALHLRRAGRFGAKASRHTPERVTALKSALRTGLESIVVSAAQSAAEEAVARWLNRSGGESLAATPGLGRASDDLPRRAGRAVAGWQEHIVEMIRTEGVTKRSVARVVSFDVESLALIFVVGLFGYGSPAADGTGGLPQRLVHALLGAESLRTIGTRARSDLRTRIATLFDDEMSRYIQVLDGAGIPDESAATRLYQATYNLEVAR